ncbi:MAG: carbohydrate kinase family protein [Lachnospiraceae bacterium]
MKHVLCIGGITTDILVKPVDALPEPGQLMAVGSLKTTVGGCAANAAIDLARLGVPVAVCCKTGRDANGDFVVREMQENGVDISGVVRTDTPTSTSIVTVNSAGERSFMYYPGSTSELGKNDISELLLVKSDIVFIASAMLLDRFDGAEAAEFLKQCQELGKYTVMDTVWDFSGRWMDKIRPSLKYLDLFMPSIDEAARLTGETDMDRIADAFFSEGVKNVIIKNGSKGAYICENGKKRYTVPAFYQPNPVDTNGAGDSFCAGFLCGLARGRGYAESAVFANAVGSHCVMGAGPYSGIVPMEQIDEFLMRKGGTAHE